MNDYQAANILGLLMRSHEHNTGDWFHELANQCYDVLMKADHNELDPDGTMGNNFGDHIPLRSTDEFRDWFSGPPIVGDAGGAGSDEGDD